MAYDFGYDPSKLRAEALRNYYAVIDVSKFPDAAIIEARDAVFSWVLFEGVELVEMTGENYGAWSLRDIRTGKTLPYYATFPKMIFEGLRGLRPDLFDMMDDLS